MRKYFLTEQKVAGENVLKPWTDIFTQEIVDALGDGRGVFSVPNKGNEISYINRDFYLKHVETLLQLTYGENDVRDAVANLRMHFSDDFNLVYFTWYNKKEYDLVTKAGTILKGTLNSLKGYLKTFGFTNTRVNLKCNSVDTIKYFKVMDKPGLDEDPSKTIYLEEMDPAICEKDMVKYYEIIKK